MIAAPLVSRVSIDRSNPLTLRATERRCWPSANVRARRGEKRRKRPSGRLKRNVLRKLEARRLLPELLHLGNSSTLNRSAFFFSPSRSVLSSDFAS